MVSSLKLRISFLLRNSKKFLMHTSIFTKTKELPFNTKSGPGLKLKTIYKKLELTASIAIMPKFCIPEIRPSWIMNCNKYSHSMKTIPKLIKSTKKVPFLLKISQNPFKKNIKIAISYPNNLLTIFTNSTSLNGLSSIKRIWKKYCQVYLLNKPEALIHIWLGAPSKFIAKSLMNTQKTICFLEMICGTNLLARSSKTKDLL